MSGISKIPPWKRSYARKAVKLRNRLTDKQLAVRLGLSPTTVSRIGRKACHG